MSLSKGIVMNKTKSSLHEKIMVAVVATMMTAIFIKVLFF